MKTILYWIVAWFYADYDDCKWRAIAEFAIFAALESYILWRELAILRALADYHL